MIRFKDFNSDRFRQNKQSAKNMLLVQNVDNILDQIELFSIEGIKNVGCPSYAAKKFEGVHTWLINRMRYAWHPKAVSYVYAYSYHLKETILDNQVDQIESILLENSSGRRNEWIDDCSLIKIGTAYRPSERRKRHLPELYKSFPDLLDKFKFRSCLLMLPCLRGNAGEYLEGSVLGSMPKEDHFYGEWFHDTIGVARTLAGWFISCHACYVRENVDKI